jgi:hypothetical protein
MKINVMHSLKQLWTLPGRKGVYVSVLFLGMGASALFGLLSAPNEPKITQAQPSDTAVVSLLNDVKKLLNSLKDSASEAKPEVNLEAITQQIAGLATRFDELHEAGSKQIAESLTHTQDTLGQELHSIKEVVTHLGDKNSSITYLPVANLPFSVVSIDSIQQVPVASVAYDFKTVPLEKGDSIAGWKVVRVDYSKQRLELENGRHERVLITQEHIG